jgi:hypothetical protein
MKGTCSQPEFGHKFIAYAVLAGQHSSCAWRLSGNFLTVSLKTPEFDAFFSPSAAGQ